MCLECPSWWVSKSCCCDWLWLSNCCSWNLLFTKEHCLRPGCVVNTSLCKRFVEITTCFLFQDVLSVPNFHFCSCTISCFIPGTSSNASPRKIQKPIPEPKPKPLRSSRVGLSKMFKRLPPKKGSTEPEEISDDGMFLWYVAFHLRLSISYDYKLE